MYPYFEIKIASDDLPGVSVVFAIYFYLSVIE